MTTHMRRAAATLGLGLVLGCGEAAKAPEPMNQAGGAPNFGGAGGGTAGARGGDAAMVAGSGGAPGLGGSATSSAGTPGSGGNAASGGRGGSLGLAGGGVGTAGAPQSGGVSGAGESDSAGMAGAGGEPSPDTVDGYCQAQCERAARCGVGAVGALMSECVSMCTSDSASIATHVRPGFFAALAACESDTGCTQSDDGCTPAAALQAAPDLMSDPNFADCAVGLADCVSDPMGLCTILFAFDDATVIAFVTCTGVRDTPKPDCDTVQACVTQYFGG